MAFPKLQKNDHKDAFFRRLILKTAKSVGKDPVTGDRIYIIQNIEDRWFLWNEGTPINKGKFLPDEYTQIEATAHAKVEMELSDLQRKLDMLIDKMDCGVGNTEKIKLEIQTLKQKKEQYSASLPIPVQLSLL